MKQNDSSTIFWGVILVVMGGLFLLRNFGVIDFGWTIRQYWPVILIVIGLFIVVKSLAKKKS